MQPASRQGLLREAVPAPVRLQGTAAHSIGLHPARMPAGNSRVSRFAIPGRILRATHGETGLQPGNPSFGEGHAGDTDSGPWARPSCAALERLQGAGILMDADVPPGHRGFPENHSFTGADPLTARSYAVQHGFPMGRRQTVNLLIESPAARSGADLNPRRFSDWRMCRRGIVAPPEIPSCRQRKPSAIPSSPASRRPAYDGRAVRGRSAIPAYE